MIVLTKEYDIEMKYNPLLLVSVSIVLLVIYLVFKNQNYFTIAPSPELQQKLFKNTISVEVITLPPKPKIIKKQVFAQAKPLVQNAVKKVPIQKEALKKTVTIPREHPKEAVFTTAAIQNIQTVKQELVVNQTAIVVDAELKKKFIAGLYKILNQNKYYPKIAKRKRLEGVAYIHFTLLKNGNLENIFIAKACGHTLLDNAALTLIKNVRKYKPIPDEISRVALNLKIPITYSIKENN